VPNTTLEYRLNFATPAFLGNAEQQAQWRTPPIKALIRQWWRVVKAPQVRFNVAELRAAESRLFGAASDDDAVTSHQSLLRLRLTGWDYGKLTNWPVGELKTDHPEVKFPVGSELYLGFGPLEYAKGTGTGLGVSKSSGQKKTAIDDKAQADLRLMFPEAHSLDMNAALQLMAWFGTLGSRSRNGWGALQMSHEQLKPLTRANLDTLRVTRSLADCLNKEWPHAIGKDETGPLVWKTRVTGDWRQVMKELARIKIAFRTQPILSLAGVAPGAFSGRHLLAYPVTNHSVSGSAWGGQGRLANQIRFKLLRENNQLIGVIAHLPCCLPVSMAAQVRTDETSQRDVWQAVHTVLDNNATRLACP
jgi:CRISPR-associated protein Cmr1